MSDVVLVNATLPGRSITVNERSAAWHERKATGWVRATDEQIAELQAARDAERRPQAPAAVQPAPEPPAEPVNPDPVDDAAGDKNKEK